MYDTPVDFQFDLLNLIRIKKYSISAIFLALLAGHGKVSFSAITISFLNWLLQHLPEKVNHETRFYNICKRNLNFKCL